MVNRWRRPFDNPDATSSFAESLRRSRDLFVVRRIPSSFAGSLRRSRDPFVVRGIPSSLRPPFVIPAEAGIQRGGDWEMQRGRRLREARGVSPAWVGPGHGRTPVRIRRMKPQLPVFTPWCAGASRDERLVRKLIADSDPGCVAPQRSAGIQREGGLVARVIPSQLNGTAAILIPRVTRARPYVGPVKSLGRYGLSTEGIHSVGRN